MSGNLCIVDLNDQGPLFFGFCCGFVFQLDPNVVGQVGHVVAFALAVGVALHAVERQVVQAHLIVTIAYQHLWRMARDTNFAIAAAAVNCGVTAVASRARAKVAMVAKVSTWPSQILLTWMNSLTESIWREASRSEGNGERLRRGGGWLGDPALPDGRRSGGPGLQGRAVGGVVCCKPGALTGRL